MPSAEALADRLAPRPHTVRGRRRETADTVTLELEDCPGFAPGQFNMLYAFGIGEIPISVSGDPARAGRVLHTVRAVGMVSSALCRLRRGDVVGLRGPFGTAWPLDSARGRDLLLVAGGVGLAPLRPALHATLHGRDGYGRVVLLYGARTPAHLLYRRELERWQARADLDVTVTVDAAAAGWSGQVGVVPALLRRAGLDPRRTSAMICGPEVMMRFTIAELRRLGVGEDSIWVSVERNMHCAVGLCGHCQLGPAFVCREGPVFRLDAVGRLLEVREL